MEQFGLAGVADAAASALARLVRYRRIARRLGQSAHVGNGLGDLPTQFSRVGHVQTATRAVVIDVAALERNAPHLLETYRQGAKLNHVALMLGKIALLEFGNDPVILFARHLVYDAANAEPVAPHPQAFTVALGSLMQGGALGHVVIGPGVLQDVFDVIASGAKDDRIDLADGQVVHLASPSSGKCRRSRSNELPTSAAKRSGAYHSRLPHAVRGLRSDSAEESQPPQPPQSQRDRTGVLDVLQRSCA